MTILVPELNFIIYQYSVTDCVIHKFAKELFSNNPPHTGNGSCKFIIIKTSTNGEDNCKCTTYTDNPIFATKIFSTYDGVKVRSTISYLFLRTLLLTAYTLRNIRHREFKVRFD